MMRNKPIYGKTMNYFSLSAKLAAQWLFMGVIFFFLASYGDATALL